MDPTISQDQTAGKEAHEHQNLSVLGKHLKDTIKPQAASQPQAQNPEQKAGGTGTFHFANPESIFEEFFKSAETSSQRDRSMDSDDFGEFGGMPGGVPGSSELKRQDFPNSPADNKWKSGFPKGRSEQRRPDTMKRERTNVNHRGYSADLRRLAISPPPPSPPPPAPYSSGGKSIQRRRRWGPERALYLEGKGNSFSSSSSVMPPPESKDDHDDWSPATDASFSSNRHVEVTEGYNNSNSEQTDASLRREELLIQKRHRRTETQGVAREEALKYGNRLKSLRSSSPGLRAQSESHSYLMNDSCISRSEPYTRYPSSAKRTQGDSVLTGVYMRKSHTERSEMSSIELPDTKLVLSQEDRKSDSEPRFLSNGKQAHEQQDEIVPIRINAEKYRYRQRPIEQPTRDEEGVYKMDAAESDVSKSADESGYRTLDRRNKEKIRAELDAAIKAALDIGMLNPVDSNISNRTNKSATEPSLIDLDIEEEIGGMGKRSTQLPSLKPNRPSNNKSHLPKHKHVQRIHSADLEDSINLRKQSLANEQEIEHLKRQNSELRKLLHQSVAQPKKPTHVVLYQVVDGNGYNCYLDRPVRLEDASGRYFYHSESPVDDVALFEEWQKREGVAFLVFETFVNQYRSEYARRSSISTSEPAIDAVNTNSVEIIIRILSPILLDAIQVVSDADPVLDRYRAHHDERDFFDMDVFAYHFLPRLRAGARYLSQEQRHQFQDLLEFLQTRFGNTWQKAQTLFGEGLVDVSTARYLFAPAHILVRRDDNKQITGVIQASFLEASYQKDQVTLRGEAHSWSFNGSFFRETIPVSVVLKASRTTTMKITELSLYPLEHAKNETVELLRLRSKTFWSCRYYNYVTYNGPNVTKDTEYFDTRFLVDVTAYLKMHGTDEKSSRVKENKLDDLETSAMASEKPPDYLLYLFPPNIYGFDIMEKKWVNLRVDCISPIRWNKSAFETLELKPESKMLIRALVSNKIAADRATDMVSGKGTGLIVLLHGGPGTGKTLTAESVAEIAEKPLYRVTCGDIGIEPREVEKYLESVFYLGRIWDCVVLLDEADVFLEQRSLEDLARNALVSVFLRTLEYYSGILILTSNRVGTFDEAFKSRIQLALHYKNLEQPQRAQIWTNFITRLQDLNESMEADGILGKVKDLSEYPMNGRQIRNAITTARQLALYNDEPLNIGHLEHSIAVSGEFDKYLIRVKGNVDDDELAEGNGYRVP